LVLKSALHQFNGREDEAIHETAKAASNNTLTEGTFLSQLNSHHPLRHFI
jgi:hypothetical protein